MMRVPGGNGNLLDAKAQGADVRMVYSPLDALQDRRGQPRQAGRVLRRRVRDHRAVDRGHRAARPRQRGIDELLRLLQPRHDRPAAQGHPRVARPAPRRLPRPRPRVDRHRQPALPVRARPVRQAPGHRRLRAPRHPPVHRRCCCASSTRAAARSRTSTPGPCPCDGQPQGPGQVLNEVFELRPHFEWRGLGFISQSALKLSDDFADFDAELRFSVPGVRVADPKACQCGEVLKGVIKPWECKVFGTACTPETPIGTCMVSSEGACAAYYNYGRFTSDPGAGRSERDRVTRRHDRRRRRRARPRRAGPRAHRGVPPAPAQAARTSSSTRPTAPGARRRPPSIDAVFLEAFRNQTLETHGRRRRPGAAVGRAHRLHHRLLRGEAPPLPGRRRSATWPSTARSTTWPMMGARPQWISAGFVLEDGFSIVELRAHRGRHGRGRRRGRRADRHRRHQGGRTRARPTAATSPPPAWASSPAGVHLDAKSVRPGDKVLVSGKIGDHGVAVLIARGELDLEADIPSDTAPLNELVEHAAGRRAQDVRFMRDPTRGGVATVLNELAREAEVGGRARQESAIPVRNVVNGACEILGIDPLYVANEGKLVAVVAAPTRPTPPWPPCRPTRSGVDAAVIGEITRRPARHRHAQDRLRRHPHRRHARRATPSPASADAK